MTFRNCVSVFVKEDRETGKAAQKPCFLCDEVAACNSTVAASAKLRRAIKSRVLAIKSQV